ncbi:MAG: hypothetical protein IJI74_01085 [Firmicutes bacterium]|nr:hypothetical protein [Bacillota bacterium]
MNNVGITNFLFAHAAKKPASFHMPGHKGAKFYKSNGFGKFMKNIADYDITEIPGADNLFQTEGIIEETANKYASLYEAEQSYLLINGTSTGLIASILATVPKGGKLIMARTCHKSVFNALTLGEITPIYAYPDVIFQYGISGAVSPEEIESLLQEHPDASAVILPSPNYYGICSDIKAIAKVVHNFGKVLIVDQAHGAHLKFFSSYGLRRPLISRPGGGKVTAIDVRKGAEAQAEYYKNHGTGQSLGEKGWKWSMPLPAEECGADIVVNSTHKTLGSFTQSAVLNVMGEAFKEAGGHIAEVDAGYLVEDPDSPFAKDHTKCRVDIALLEDRLQAIQSTSPSYLLMASLDVNADIIEKHGKKLFTEWRRNIVWFFRKAATIPELRVMTVEADEKSVVAEAAEKSLGILKKVPGLRDKNFAKNDAPRRQTGSLDNTKINIDMSAYGIDGNRLEEMLNEQGIFPELVTGNIVMCMTGIGNKRKDYKRLYKALAEIAFRNRGSLVKLSHDDRIEYKPVQQLEAPEEETGTGSSGTDPSPSDDGPKKNAGGGSFAAKSAALWSKRRILHELPAEKESLPLEECAGRICASSIIPYPPGIPLICPGEEIGAEEIQYIKYLRQIGDKVIGISSEGEIIVGK